MPAARTPQDRKPKTVRAEAKKEDIAFTYEGVDYLIVRTNADNLELMEFVEDEKYLTAIRGYLGPDQWKKWKDASRTEDGRVPSEAFEPFMQAVMDAIGGKGNS